MELAGRVVSGTPAWVWAVLVLLIVLGWRRLKPRRTRLALAALAPTAFLLWSLTTAAGLGDAAGIREVWGVWVAAFAAGAASAPIRLGPRPTPLPDGAFLFPGTPFPLIVYAGVFTARYTLGVTAAFRPDLANALGLAGLAISAVTAGRFAADLALLLRARAGP